MKPKTRRGWMQLGSLVFGIVVLVALFLGLWVWIVPFTRSPQFWNLAVEGRAALVGNQLQAWAVIIQVLGAMFFFGTLLLTIQNLQVAQEELRASQDAQITERFTRATDQLG